MNEKNKLSLSLYAKLGILFLWTAATIIACAGNWNFNPEGFVKWCTGILFIMNLVAIGYLGYKWVKEYNARIEEIQREERQKLIDQANNRK